MVKEVYTYAQWSKDKVLIAQGINRGRYKKVKQLLHDIHLVTDNQVINNQAIGMLLVLDIISGKDTQ